MTMPKSAEHWFSLALRTLLDCVNMYAAGSAALDEKLTLRRYALFYTLETAVEVAYCLIWDPTYSGAAFLCAILVVALQARFVFGRRGWAFLRATAAMLLAQCAFVAFCAPVGVLLWGAERANAIVVSQGFDRLWQSVLNVVLMPPTCLIIRQARRLALRCREMASDVVYILRSALLCGAHGVIIPRRGGVGVTGTVMKVSAGAAARVPVARVANLAQTIRQLKENNIFVYCADLGGEPLERTDLSGPVALVLGSEGAGPGALVRKLCDGAVTLAMAGGETGVDSYNVSVAAGILMYSIMQRRK